MKRSFAAKLARRPLLWGLLATLGVVALVVAVGTCQRPGPAGEDAGEAAAGAPTAAGAATAMQDSLLTLIGPGTFEAHVVEGAFDERLGAALFEVGLGGAVAVERVPAGAEGSAVHFRMRDQVLGTLTLTLHRAEAAAAPLDPGTYGPADDDLPHVEAALRLGGRPLAARAPRLTLRRAPGGGVQGRFVVEVRPAEAPGAAWNVLAGVFKTDPATEAP